MGQRKRNRAKMDAMEGFDRALAFDRTVDRARRLSPSLFPPEITYGKYIYDDGSCEQIYRHPALGELGRIRIEQRDGRTHIGGLVTGNTEDELHAQREALFTPIMEALAGADNRRCFQGKHMQCERCGAIAASLIFIDGTEPWDFMDCARLMYPEYSRGTAPVWIIGPPVGRGPESERAADVLKVWPEREPVRRMRPAKFNPICERLVAEHCSRKISQPRRTSSPRSKKVRR
jgi:hypothetical protein